MRPLTIGDLKLGEGIPKICVPIVGRTVDEILMQAKEICLLPADLVEWRCDWYEDAHSTECVLGVATELRKRLGEKVLLFTFRTAEEGGEQLINHSQYIALNKSVIASGYVDMIDVELFRGDDVMEELVAYAREHGRHVVASNHDFDKTPMKEEIVRRLLRMQELGADIAKIAVMPQTKEDVQVLLEATKEVSQQDKSGPIITMSMSGLGRISRIQGEIYGSSVTFAAAREASAPGQIPVEELIELLQEVHERI